jgi:hypothetical protein
MFKADRVFSERNPTTGTIKWYFASREGIMGPYETKQIAQCALMDYKAKCMHSGSTGGRDTGGKEANVQVQRKKSDDWELI